MKVTSQKVGISFCVGIVLLLFLPLTQGLLRLFHERGLYGYIDPVPEKPNHYVASFFNKSLQTWTEKKFNATVGLRAFLIKSFNEVNFRVFHEADNSFIKLFFLKKHGLYSDQTIESLNYDIVYKKELEQTYYEDAKQLLKIQTMLAQQGKYFIVVVAASKAYIYPKALGKRLLIGGSDHLLERTANFASILKEYGVHIIDSKYLLNKTAHQEKIETHPPSGVHWNYYSGCLVAKEILFQAKTYFSNLATIDCNPYQRMMPPMNNVDVDGYSLLNLWSHANVVKLTTYPTITSKETDAHWKPKMVIIGDSFSDQIRFIFKEMHIYSRMVMSSYFKQREVEDQSGNIQQTGPEKPFESELLADISDSDIVILEMVDYNLHRQNEAHMYGFTKYFLKTYGKEGQAIV